MTQRTASPSSGPAFYCRIASRAVAAHDRRRAFVATLSIFRSLALTWMAGSAIAGTVAVIASALFGAKSDLRVHSPMRLETKVALAGPYGALANAREILDPVEVAMVQFPPKRQRTVLDVAADPARSAVSSIALPLAPLAMGEPMAFAPTTQPKPEPLRQQVAVAAPAGPQLASLNRPVTQEPRAPRLQEQTDKLGLPDVDEKTAIYDISARAVYLPGGQKLEAHSGLGEKMDDPRFVHVRMRGATPPNTYRLSLREQLFHGVRAIRLNPLDGGKMFGRDGILAHTYMLGPSGQSNGCVSFDNYTAFLNAYLRGDVDRMVVVARLPKPPTPALFSARRRNERYATADAPETTGGIGGPHVTVAP